LAFIFGYFAIESLLNVLLSAIFSGRTFLYTQRRLLFYGFWRPLAWAANKAKIAVNVSRCMGKVKSWMSNKLRVIDFLKIF